MAEYNPQLEADFDKADELLTDKYIEEGKILILSILERDHSYGKAHNHLGWIYHWHEVDYENAEKEYKLAMQYSPEYDSSYINYIYLLATQKRFPELEKHLQLCETVPGINKATLTRQWAYLYEDTMRFDLAITKYKEWAMSEHNSEMLDKINQDIKVCKLKKQIQEA